MIVRLRGHDAFAQVARDGTRTRGTTLWCTHLYDPSAASTAVAFAIGRAVGTAVVRNRLRRRLRSILRELDTSGALPPGLLLIGSTPHSAERTFDELRQELVDLLTSTPESR